MRTKLFFSLGGIQLVIGAFIALRPLIGTGAPLTGSRVLDMAFAAYFLIRGVMNIRAASRAVDRTDAVTDPPGPPTP